jgi:hypothetical protein
MPPLIAAFNGPEDWGDQRQDHHCSNADRFPPEIIQHAIWLYVRSTLSYRDVEELLAEPGRISPTRRSGAGC